jgi:hypothetical protein
MRDLSYRLGVVLAPTSALPVVQTSNDDFHLRAVLDWSCSD